MSGRFRDFDEAVQETTRTPPSFQLFGETIELPPSMPVVVRLLMVRRHEEQGTAFSWSSIEEYFTHLVGAEKFSEWLEKGITEDKLSELTSWALFQAYEAAAEEDDPEGEAEAPAVAGATEPASR